MRIRPVVEILDRRQLKPDRGDEVLYEGEVYIVTEVGMRWVHMYRKDDDRKFLRMARISQVSKYVPPPKEESVGFFNPFNP